MASVYSGDARARIGKQCAVQNKEVIAINVRDVRVSLSYVKFK